MTEITYTQFKEAVDCLGLLKKITKEEIRKKYLKLSKKYHPDVEGGDKVKFQEINKSYEIVTIYLDNFKYNLDAEEFKHQRPFSYDENKSYGVF
ncbi:MAG: DnaJ domain-containing protein [Campylobacterales bacterium]|nr:DnaJ domain-containing protein [Campylobacterales bacterium]